MKHCVNLLNTAKKHVQEVILGHNNLIGDDTGKEKHDEIDE